MSNYILPKLWAIELNKDNKNIINKWFNDGLGRIEYYNGYDDFMHYPNELTREGFKGGEHHFIRVKEGYELISFEQFQQYVLNVQPELEGYQIY